MIRHILRLETDAGRNLSRLKNIVAIEVENGFVLGEAVAQGNIHIARRRRPEWLYYAQIRSPSASSRVWWRE